MIRRLLVIVFVLFLGGCNSSQEEYTEADTHTDTVTTLGTDSILGQKTNMQSPMWIYRGYICDENAQLYEDSLLKRRLVSLGIGDSVEILDGDSIAHKFNSCLNPHAIYKVKWRGRDSGYISGSKIAEGWHADTDGESGDELVTARYINIKSEYDDEIADNPVEIRIIKGNRIQSRINVTGYSEMYFNYYGRKGFPEPVRFFEFRSGYPACGYSSEAYLIYYDGNKYNVLATRTFAGDADVFAHWSDYIFPADSSGSPGKLTIYDHHYEAGETDGDTVKLTTRKEVYSYLDGKLKLSELDTSQRPYDESPFR